MTGKIERKKAAWHATSVQLDLNQGHCNDILDPKTTRIPHQINILPWFAHSQNMWGLPGSKLKNRHKPKPWKTSKNLLSLFPGEPLHGYRVCIQAILQDKPRIATQNLPEVSECVSLSPADNLQITASLPLSSLNVQLLFFSKYLCFFKISVSVVLSSVLGIFLWQ